MSNHEILRSLSTMEAAKMICYLCYDCDHCPIEERKDLWSMETCWDALAVWLGEAKDETFWEWILERSEG